MKITVAGAGAIGCFTGGLLARGGHDVTLLGRARVLEPIAAEGLELTDYTGLSAHLPPEALTLSTDPACLGAADLVIVAVKTGATAEMAAAIAAHAPQAAPVISFQNGLESAATLRASLPGRDLRAAMVPFNVVSPSPARFHRATSGEIVIEAGPGALANALSVEGLTVLESAQIVDVQWGKLLINLTNALNALSGLTLQQMLLDRRWRRLMADQMAEAMAVLKAAGIGFKPQAPLPPGLIPPLLRLPTPLFKRIAAQMLTIDPEARTSMAYDLADGRATEIDALQGEILRLARETGVQTPLTARIAARLARAEAAGKGSPELDPGELENG
ncbi:2-dehydropantoate 2-reductase [Pseudoruegeria sp. SHC-113]|uniref:2-dehydropantoate 2-reductase n=1 Tax=Pseudoruegeria sp. SHC-113 TaxID=2855439 RepID=UPI0021BBA82C|nr:2-dehydropantoate 2-reductase [Pseudoruegeria sp. SHC-113]MCT8161768.1 2-dehydropantoate 2-reductase [Pseudoruegeria sp. SHC-113]